MGDGITIVVVKNDLAALALKLASEAESLVADTANKIEAEMKSATSARIAGTINARRSNGGRTATVTAGDLKSAIHAGFEEYGTVSHSARPFATPAAEANRSDFVRGMQHLLDRGL